MHNVLYVIGPTASGKSAYAVELAQRHNGVVINADSMQIYQGVDVITAIPSESERQGICHQLYGCISPVESYNVVRWRDTAIQCIYKALQRGKTPILCGGTGLYASAMLSGLSPIPDVDDSIRTTVRQMDTDDAYTVLCAQDPIMAQRLQRGDTQRIARALEIIRGTGKSLAYFQDLPPVLIPEDIKIKLLPIMPDRQTVYNRINDRYQWMFENGAVEEVRALLNQGVPQHAQIMRAIGVPETIKYIQGVYDASTTIEKGKTATRRYAKRQMTYIRHQLSPYVGTI